MCFAPTCSRVLLLALMLLAGPGCSRCADPPSRPATGARLQLRDQRADLPRALTVVTYNVLADPAQARLRVPALLALLRRSGADIIALQEVAPWFLRRLLAQRWTRAYQLPGTRHKPVVAHGCLIMSRLPLVSYRALVLPSKQQRQALLVTLRAGQRTLAVATVHLDSFLHDGPSRARQLQRLWPELARADDALLLGDFNFGDGEQPETGELEPAYVDAWLRLRPGQPGYTWDMERSQMARAGAFPGERSRRLDRILLRSQLWRPSAVAIIGQRPVAPGVFPSDHFGLQAVLAR